MTITQLDKLIIWKDIYIFLFGFLKMTGLARTNGVGWERYAILYLYGLVPLDICNFV